MQRPPYEATDSTGLPFTRTAQTVGELPVADRLRALDSATQSVARLLEMSAVRRISFGTPVFVSFGISRNQAKVHPHAKLMLTNGCDLGLELCPEYD